MTILKLTPDIFMKQIMAKGIVVDLIEDLKEKVSKNVSIWRGNLEIIEKK